MAQQVKIAGALFNDVPSISVPDNNNVYHPFVDTSDANATAGDIASGKTAYVNGSKVTGNASTPTLITKSITQNGTYNASSDNADGYSSVTVNVSGGGGATNFVQGTFTTGSTAGVSTFTIPYSGSGYPIMFLAYVNGGVINNTSGGDADWVSLVKRYAIGLFLITKQEMNTTPRYKASTSLTENLGTVNVVYKNSTSDPASYATSGGINVVTHNEADATSTQNNVLRFKGDGTTVSYYVIGSSGRGLAPSTTYAYIAVYSS